MNVHSAGRQLLIHGLLLILVGLVWGLFVAGTPYPRLALGAHIQLVTNGILLMIQAFSLLLLPHSIGNKSVLAMIAAAWLTWGMALSEVGNAWWGTTTMLTIAAKQAGASGGEPWQELVVQATHISAGLGLILSWLLLVIGLIRISSNTESAPTS